MSKYIDAEKLLEKEKALLKRLMAFRNALAGEEAKCAGRQSVQSGNETKLLPQAD